MITDLPLCGTCHTVDALNAERERLVEDLKESMARPKHNSNKGTYFSWFKYFKDEAGKDSTCQLASFCTYWLSFFVFPNPSIMGSTLSYSLWRPFWAKKNRSRWHHGFWILYSKRLDDCGHNIVPSIAWYDVICYPEVNFDQLFLWSSLTILLQSR